MTAPVLVAEAPRGTPATRVPARTTQDLGVVALVAPPGSRAHLELPLDILAELGKQDDVAGRSSHTQDAAALVPLWLLAHRTEWVVVTSPNVLAVPALQLLPTLTLPAGTRLLLACDAGTSTQVLAGLGDYGARRTEWARLDSLVPPPDPPAPQQTPDPTGPLWTERDLTLPRSDWPTFRTDCRRLLRQDVFAAVDATYVRAFCATRQWLRENQPTEQATAALVGGVVGAEGSLDTAVVALRACQAAHMEAGWLLRVDLEQAINAISQRPGHLGDAEWQSLRAYRDPHRSAAVTLHQHGLAVASMHRLAVGDVHPAGHTVDQTVIDPRGHAYLRAQLLHRRADGAGDHDLLFVAEPRRTVNAIRNARDELALRLGTGRVSADEHLADRWQRRLGLKLWDCR